MKASDLRKLSVDALKSKLAEEQQEVFEFRMQQSAGEFKKAAQLQEARRCIARIMTVLQEKE